MSKKLGHPRWKDSESKAAPEHTVYIFPTQKGGHQTDDRLTSLSQLLILFRRLKFNGLMVHD